MASINDLATAATIASSAVALQSSPTPTREGAQSATPPAAPQSPPSSKPATATAQNTTPSLADNSKSADASHEDGDSITVATGAPPVLAPPQISSQNPPSQAQIPAPAPSAPEAAPEEDAAGNNDGAEDKDAPRLSAGEDMDGVEQAVAPPPKPVRGAFVVFEGMDRAGKTTQAKLLQQRCIESGREVTFMRFPDRATPIGKMIDSYLKGETEIEDHVIHLLFSANRWEAVKKIKAELEAGHTIICDRFYHSGIVYSAAKNIKTLSLSWAKAPEIGLPRPDMVLFLDLEEEVARGRGGWGGEVYEKGEMQRRVRDLFWGLSMGDLGSAVGNSGSSKVPRRNDVERLGNGTSRGGDGGGEDGEFRQEEEDIQIVDADLDVESLSERVWELVLPRLEAVERGEVGRTVRTVR
ncbi:thymidylate kinase-domain-containing protein [Daldinia caldariorum]|uniref:thymidylate kinase-domain-containing protein n=1 Tax=Daldinia caldariorum TaxID=326644 RepID=UPI0020078869|nr:thymidylate kinase-domain-containing protein [Daldinia caldariorum]KAI1466452.1 thymidylate kinase-domain-containing protein [Daldinia caldariorum]